MIAISIVIPFYNRSTHFERLFRSLSDISMDNVEVIFVDNNSSLSERNILNKLCGKLTLSTTLSISIIEETRCGAAAARNAGLRYARGEYVYFFDSDDEFSSGLLPEVFLKAKEGNYDIVAFRTNVVFPNGKIRKKRMIYNSDPNIQILCNNLATQSILLRRSFALIYGLWNETLYYWNDLEWGLRILLAKPKQTWLNGCYHRIYLHTDSITGSHFSDKVTEIIHAHKVIRDDIMQLTQNRERKKLLKSLNFRIAIYAGHVSRETSKEHAMPIMADIDKNVAGFMHKIKLSLLYFFSSKGIPGLWLIALA